MHHSFRFQPRTEFGNRLVVCYQLESRSHGTPVWIVLCPLFPGTQHWMGLMSTVVSKPNTALTTVQSSWLVLPCNSIGGCTTMPWVQYSPKPTSRYTCRCYAFMLCALESGFTYMGILHLQIPLQLHRWQINCSATQQPI